MSSEHRMSYLLFGFISLLQVSLLHSQTPPYYHYTTSDGLGSSTVYYAMQDRDGFIWFGTLNGLSRFDGKRFTTYRTKDGLNSNVITSVVEGDEGELYAANFEKGINILEDGKIEDYCSEVNGKSFSMSYLMKYQKKLYAYHGLVALISFSQKTDGGPAPHNIPTYPSQLYRLAQLSDNNLVASTTRGLYAIKNDSLVKMSISGLKDTSVFSLTPGSDGSFFVGTRGMIYQIKKNSVIRRFRLHNDGEVNQLYTDRNDNIWFAVRSKGAFLIPAGSDEIINIGRKMGLEKTQVNNYLEDREGNIWINTFGKGVYCLNNLYLTNYSEKDGLGNNDVHSIVKVRSGRLVIGTFNGIDILENGVFDHLKDNSGKPFNGDVSSIKEFGDTLYVSWGALGGSRYVPHKGLRFFLLFARSFHKTSDGLYLNGSWFNTINVQRSPERARGYFPLPIFGDSARTNRLYDIVEDSRKNIWVGTGLGLSRLSFLPGKSGRDAWQKSFFPDDPVLNSRINSIYADRKNNVWFAGVKGIARYNLENDSVTSYNSISGFDVSSATSIVSDNKNRLWIGTMSGLYLYDGNFIEHLNSQTGLPSDEVLSLYYDNDRNVLYVGTSNGFSSLDIGLFEGYKPSPLSVKIISIKAGDSVYTKYENLVFEPEQDNIYLDFKALNFASPGTVKYKYKLYDEWIETEYDFLNLISLHHGTYSLQIMAKAHNTDWGEPSLLAFSIKPRFSETIWFNVGIIALFVAASGSTVAWRLKRHNEKIRKQLELTEKINELEHQALSAMMNPHFIFNALNSVQYLINSQRNEEANEYIAMMAKLIRKNLDVAGNAFILLSEEINRLKLYLDLEKLRFQERFTYEIITGRDLDVGSVMIPNMIIQPFVENTLWHGMVDAGSSGLVTISFAFENVEIDSVTCRSLIIKITDNGIGIREALKKKKEDHTSKGIQIIEERLKLLSTKLQLPQPIVFEDLSSRNSDSHGTEVIISLPPPLHRIIIPESAAGSASSPPA